MEKSIIRPPVGIGKALHLLCKNNKGASLVYVLMTLVFVGAIAMLVLNSARKETIDSSLRASSEMARFAATSGLTLAATLLSNPAANIPAQGITSQDLLRILYFRSEGRNAQGQPLQADETRLPLEAQRWIVGGENAFLPDENGMRFRVRIMNIDFSQIGNITEEIPLSGTPAVRRFRNGRNLNDSRITVQFQSEAIDPSGSRARNIGVFQVFGYEDPGGVINIPTSALYLNGGIDFINTRLTVRGDTFLRGAGVMNHNDHLFDGEFRRRGRPTGAEGGRFIVRGATFNGPVFFGLDTTPPVIADAPIQFEPAPAGAIYTFNDAVGSESSIIANTLNFHNDVFLNAGAVAMDGHGRWRFHGNSRLMTRNGRTYGAGGLNPPGGGAGNSRQGAQFLFSATDVNLRPHNFNPPGNLNLSIDLQIPFPHVPWAVAQNFFNVGWNHASTAPMDLLDSLNEHSINGVSLIDPPAIDIDLTRLTEMEYQGRWYSGSMLNALFASATTAANRAANNGWMVLRWRQDPAGGDPFCFDRVESGCANDLAGFTGRMVLILDNQSAPAGAFTTQFFRSAHIPNNPAASGITVIVVEPNLNATQLGNNGMIRGLIINRGVGGLALQTSGDNMTIQGAVYNVGTGALGLTGGPNMPPNQPGRITINYDEVVLREIMETLPAGTITIEGAEVLPPNLALIPPNLNPRGAYTEILNRWF